MTLGLMWKWPNFFDVFSEILPALRITLEITILGCAVALGSGWIWVFLRRIPFAPLRGLVWLVLEFVRDTPPLVHVLVGFYVLPHYGVMLSPVTISILVLGIHYSAYISEIYRGSIAALPVGQFEAARVLQFSVLRSWISVIIPQVYRESLPALGNVILSLLKETALLIAIGVPVLMTVAQRAGERSFRYAEPLTVAALLYCLVTIPFGRLLRWVEARDIQRSR